MLTLIILVQYLALTWEPPHITATQTKVKYERVHTPGTGIRDGK